MKSFYQRMNEWRNIIRTSVDLAEKECPDAVPYADCPNHRRKCPFKVEYDKGEYSCELGAMRMIIDDGDEV